MNLSFLYILMLSLIVFLSDQKKSNTNPLLKWSIRYSNSLHPVPSFKHWRLKSRGSVDILHTIYTDVAYYVPKRARRILVLAHGYPWNEGSVTGTALIEYARADVIRWSAFAEQNNLIVMAPAFGGANFVHYGQMKGKLIRPDLFINELVDGPAARLIPHFNGKFNLHGHSAGAQFAARYAIMHPERLSQVILSAPSTYPMPEKSFSWPYGMGSSEITPGQFVKGKSGLNEAGSDFIPQIKNWLSLAISNKVTVLVGSKDLEQRPPAPGQKGSTRLARAINWVDAMRKYTSSKGKTAKVTLYIADGLDHDEKKIAVPAQNIFAQKWGASRLWH